MGATYDSKRMRQAGAFAQRSASLLVCSAVVVACANAAEAQCSAQDVLRNHLALKGAPPARDTATAFSSAAEVPFWKRTFRELAALRDAMSALGCAVGSSADEIIGRPALPSARTRQRSSLLAYRQPNLALRANGNAAESLCTRAIAGPSACTRRSRAAAKASVSGPADRRISYHGHGADQDMGW
jgi:hypothetical protein